MTEDGPAVLDTDTPLQRLKGDIEFLHALQQVFLDDLPQKLDGLRDAVENGPMEAVLRASHSLKGASATIGAQALREAAAELEAAARAEDPHAVREAYAPIPGLADELADTLRRELG